MNEKFSLLIRFIIWIVIVTLSMIELSSSYYLLDNNEGFKFYNDFCRIVYYILVICNPLIVLYYSFQKIYNYVKVSDDIYELTTREDSGEKVYYFFRNMSNSNKYIGIPVILIIATLGYFKLFPIISFIFLPNIIDVRNIIYTTLFPFSLIHGISQTIPTMIIRFYSAELNENSVLMDKFNYYNFTSLFFLIFTAGLYMLRKCEI